MKYTLKSRVIYNDDKYNHTEYIDKYYKNIRIASKKYDIDYSLTYLDDSTIVIYDSKSKNNIAKCDIGNIKIFKKYNNENIIIFVDLFENGYIYNICKEDGTVLESYRDIVIDDISNSDEYNSDSYELKLRFKDKEFLNSNNEEINISSYDIDDFKLIESYKLSNEE